MNYWRLVRQILHSETPVMKERPGSTFVLGRDRTVSIKCRSTYVSRKHCTIEFADGQWTIRDLGSLNGTFLNTIKIKSGETKELKEDDIIGIGIGDMTGEQLNPNLYVFKWCKIEEAVATALRITPANSSSSSGTTTKRVVRRKKRSHSKVNRPSSSNKAKRSRVDSSSSSIEEENPEETNDILQSCHICFEKFAKLKKLGEPLHSTLCGHIFCRNCIEASLLLQPHCPVCRHKIAPNSTHRVFI